MLTWSSYTLSGSPQQCAFCRRPFPSIEGRREAFLSRYTDEIRRAYPPRGDGKVMLKFPRLFIVAIRGGGA